jgi:SAM-dependent methyltransferase
MNDSAIEKAKYRKMWEFDSYRERSPGLRFIDDALARMKPEPGASIIDLGCGTGRVSNHLKQLGYNVTALDIAANACTEFDGPFIESCIWEIGDIGQFDYGFCADVMEHLPTEQIDKTLECIKAHVGTCYFQIANFYCHEGDKIGESLHLTVKPCDWWEVVLKRHFSSVSITAEPKHHIAVCR